MAVQDTIDTETLQKAIASYQRRHSDVFPNPWTAPPAPRAKTPTIPFTPTPLPPPITSPPPIAPVTVAPTESLGAYLWRRLPVILGLMVCVLAAVAIGTAIMGDVDWMLSWLLAVGVTLAYVHVSRTEPSDESPGLFHNGEMEGRASVTIGWALGLFFVVMMYMGW